MNGKTTANGDMAAMKRDKNIKDLQRTRSMVRVQITILASWFLFVGGALLIGFFLYAKDYPMAKDMFVAIMPVSASIIAFWFGGRGSSQAAGTQSISPIPEKTP